MDETLTEESKKILREKQIELIKLIEALAKLDKSEEWNTLRELTFDRSLDLIKRQLLQEALKPDLDLSKLYNLQGQWAWANQYSDIDRTISTLKNQLAEIKKKLHE